MITFYVYAKIGQVNGGAAAPPPAPLDPPLLPSIASLLRVVIKRLVRLDRIQRLTRQYR